MSVEYKKEFFEVVNKVLPIKKTQDPVISTLFTNEEDGVYFRFLNNGVACILKGEKECFGLDTESVGIYDYSEFFRAFTVLENPSININNNKVTFSDEKSKLNYVLVEEDSLNENIPFKNVDFPEEHINIDISVDDLKKIKKMFPILNKNGSKENIKIKFTLNSGVVTMLCYTDEQNDDSWETQFTTDSKIDSLETIIGADIFDVLPVLNYKLRISEELVNFNYENELLSLNLYIMKMEEI